MSKEYTLKLTGVRVRTLSVLFIFTALFIAVLLIGSRIGEEDLLTDLEHIFLPPSVKHPFGTDWVGRDMLLRTLKGMSISMQVGLISTALSVIIALALGILAPIFGGVADYLVSWLIDFVLSVPHTILIILISIACGGGLRGIITGIVCTHWTSLTRVIRAEVLQLKSAEYIQIAEKFGKSRWYIAVHHIFPAVIPQLAVGAVLLFPHAILHEASITFLGDRSDPGRVHEVSDSREVVACIVSWDQSDPADPHGRSNRQEPGETSQSIRSTQLKGQK